MPTSLRKVLVLLVVASGLCLVGCQSESEEQNGQAQGMSTTAPSPNSEQAATSYDNSNAYIGNGAFGETPP